MAIKLRLVIFLGLAVSLNFQTARFGFGAAQAIRCICWDPLVVGMAPGEEEVADLDHYCNCVPPDQLSSEMRQFIYFGPMNGLGGDLQWSQKLSQDYARRMTYYVLPLTGEIQLVHREPRLEMSQDRMKKLNVEAFASSERLLSWNNPSNRPWSTVRYYHGSVEGRMLRHTLALNSAYEIGAVFGFESVFFEIMTEHIYPGKHFTDIYEQGLDEFEELWWDKFEELGWDELEPEADESDYYYQYDVFDDWFSEWFRQNISEFAGISQHAAFADSFAYYISDDYEIGSLPTEAEAMFADMINIKVPDSVKMRPDIRRFWEDEWVPRVLSVMRSAKDDPLSFLAKKPSAALGFDLLLFLESEK